MAYLHGFASGPASFKGTVLAEWLRARGHHLELPDLNEPSFGELTVTAALGAMDALDALDSGGRPWRLIGSSMGGYLAARWAQIHPEKVDRMVLLCPGFDMRARWAALLGPQAMGAWRETGRHLFPDASGVDVGVHWGFVVDGDTHPRRPEPACPVRVIHGVADEVVPVEISRSYAAEHPDVDLVEVMSDHGLADQIPRIQAEVGAFFGVQ
jgi:hypothetical protein